MLIEYGLYQISRLHSSWCQSQAAFQKVHMSNYPLEDIKITLYWSVILRASLFLLEDSVGISYTEQQSSV